MSQTDGQAWGPEREEQPRETWVQEPPKLSGRVQLADYDPRWPAYFDLERPGSGTAVSVVPQSSQLLP